ncbi:MAG: hypothetical protein LUD07_09905, partial [Clostridiales bacterium]|nr:hypothetical protein [Clostridiales bacterium]
IAVIGFLSNPGTVRISSSYIDFATDACDMRFSLRADLISDIILASGISHIFRREVIEYEMFKKSGNA